MDADDTVIYVGKAKNLKKRVSSYFNKARAESGKPSFLTRIMSSWRRLLGAGVVVPQFRYIGSRAMKKRVAFATR